MSGNPHFPQTGSPVQTEFEFSEENYETPILTVSPRLKETRFQAFRLQQATGLNVESNATFEAIAEFIHRGNMNSD